jgi:predicted RNA binding protein YcfA (HicA-like mRNA interferase family)
MPKLRTLSGAQVRAILEAHGFVLARHDGTSHMIMQKATATGTITVVVPAHKTLKTGTLSGIIRQSGLGRGPFES